MILVQLFLDWDGTITKHDTILPLSRLGYRVNELKGIETRPWDEIVKAYLEDLNKHASTYQPTKESRITIEEESKYLASLKPVERASITRVVDSGIFAQITKAELDEGVRDAVRIGDVELRPGWEKLFDSCLDNNPSTPAPIDVAIVTVNWSAAFIRSCLLQSARNSDIDDSVINNMPIYGNEVNRELAQDSIPTVGDLSSPNSIQTSADKLAALQSVIVAGKDKAKAKGHEHVSIYVGDTATDFDCLLYADIGVCINDVPLRGGQQELASTFVRVNVEILPLREAQWPVVAREGERKTVYWTNDLGEVADMLREKMQAT